jgi:toluene monooxygenase system protein D
MRLAAESGLSGLEARKEAMGSHDRLHSGCVGPVLEAGLLADAVIAAIQESNQGVTILRRGSYNRVLVPARCAVSRADVENHLGRSLRFPADLEKIMPSFKGDFSVTEDRAEWKDLLAQDESLQV